ncbi:hypothetical protein L6164_008827 [Bauhinia variegata]|uniref:Uncharacterized protein n=1 Tax=Bauhinia variegata TaxID=167791 RepID=A0ACB9PNH2_BAUVA|nr:hypothetical protein L6164_008827 [Bauhinia variegata]
MTGVLQKLRIQSTDVKAIAMWGVAACSDALYLIQVMPDFISVKLSSRIYKPDPAFLLTIGETLWRSAIS